MSGIFGIVLFNKNNEFQFEKILSNMAHKLKHKENYDFQTSILSDRFYIMEINIGLDNNSNRSRENHPNVLIYLKIWWHYFMENKSKSEVQDIINNSVKIKYIRNKT